jgi:natural product precursor
MKTIKKIKLTVLSKNDKNALEKKRMNTLKGGKFYCMDISCSCGTSDPAYSTSSWLIMYA